MAAKAACCSSFRFLLPLLPRESGRGGGGGGLQQEQWKVLAERGGWGEGLQTVPAKKAAGLLIREIRNVLKEAFKYE